MPVVLHIRADDGFKYTAFTLLVNPRDIASDIMEIRVHVYAFKMLPPFPSQTGIKVTARASSPTTPDSTSLRVRHRRQYEQRHRDSAGKLSS